MKIVTSSTVIDGMKIESKVMDYEYEDEYETYWNFKSFHTRFISFMPYTQHKSERWWQPSFNRQIYFGLAINWLGLRLRVGVR